MADQVKTVTNRLSRTASPYVFPSGVDDCLEASFLEVSGEKLTDGMTLTLDPGGVETAPQLNVQLEGAALAAIHDDWALGPEGLLLTVLVEASFLNLLEVDSVRIDSASAQDTGYRYQTVLPDWVLKAVGRTKIGISVLLTLADEIPEPSTEWMPSHKGAILATWAVSLGVPSLVHWFTPRPLNADARARLNKYSTTPLAESTTLYVRCNGLLEEKPLEDALEIYIDEDLAQILNAASPSSAIKAVESQVAYQVLNEMLDSMAADAGNGEPLSPDSAGRPLLELLSESTGQTPEALFELLSASGASSEVLALRTHLQAAATTTATAIGAARKGDG